jgi:CheY-like chemotaxis protein
VLVADNNRISQRVARAMLENLGFEVDVACDGVAAVRAAAQKAYRTVLVDCSTQALDSDHTATEIRRGGSSRGAAIIAVSASPTSAEQERCAASGMDDFVAKPFRGAVFAALFGGEITDGTRPGVTAAPRRTGGSDEATPPHPGQPVIDEDVLAQLAQLGGDTGDDFLGELAALFLADADAHVVALRQARADADAESVARLAHALSGASANLGATELARLCAAAATPDGASALLVDAILLEGVESELSRVRSLLQSRQSTT